MATKQIGLLQIFCSSRLTAGDTDWALLLSSCPNLKHVEFRGEVIEEYGSDYRIRPYIPLNSEERRQKLARDVVAGDWHQGFGTLEFENEAHDLAAAYHRTTGAHCSEGEECGLRITAVVTIFAANLDGEGYKQVCASRSLFQKALGG